MKFKQLTLTVAVSTTTTRAFFFDDGFGSMGNTLRQMANQMDAMEKQFQGMGSNFNQPVSQNTRLDDVEANDNTPQTYSVSLPKHNIPQDAKTYKISSPSGRNEINVQKYTVSDKRNGNVHPVHVERYTSDQGLTKVAGERWASDQPNEKMRAERVAKVNGPNQVKMQRYQKSSPGMHVQSYSYSVSSVGGAPGGMGNAMMGGLGNLFGGFGGGGGGQMGMPEQSDGPRTYSVNHQMPIPGMNSDGDISLLGLAGHLVKRAVMNEAKAMKHKISNIFKKGGNRQPDDGMMWHQQQMGPQGGNRGQQAEEPKMYSVKYDRDQERENIKPINIGFDDDDDFDF